MWTELGIVVASVLLTLAWQRWDRRGEQHLHLVLVEVGCYACGWTRRTENPADAGLLLRDHLCEPKP